MDDSYNTKSAFSPHYYLISLLISDNCGINYSVSCMRIVMKSAGFGPFIYLPIPPQLKNNDIFVCKLLQAFIAKVGQEVLLYTAYRALKPI